MILDEFCFGAVTHIYDVLEKNPESFNDLYVPGAKLTISKPDLEETVVESDYLNSIPASKRVFLRWNGAKVGNFVVFHVTGLIQDGENWLQTHEMIVLDTPPDPIHIRMHTINMTKGEAPQIEEEVKESPPKPEEEPEKVEEKPKAQVPVASTPSDLFYLRTVYLYNLPFSANPMDILPELDGYGLITRVCHTKGSILVEFQNPDSVMTVVKDGRFEWRQRIIGSKPMEKNFVWPEIKPAQSSKHSNKPRTAQNNRRQR